MKQELRIHGFAKENTTNFKKFSIFVLSYASVIILQANVHCKGCSILSLLVPKCSFHVGCKKFSINFGWHVYCSRGTIWCSYEVQHLASSFYAYTHPWELRTTLNSCTCFYWAKWGNWILIPIMLKCWTHVEVLLRLLTNLVLIRVLLQ